MDCLRVPEIIWNIAKMGYDATYPFDMGILSGDAAGFIMFYPMDCISYADSIGIQPRLDLETSDPSSNHQIVNGLVLLEKHVYIIFLTISIYI